MRPVVVAALVAFSSFDSSGPAQAQQAPTPFDSIMSSGTPECVSMDTVARLAKDGLKTLNEAQFQFVRAAYAFIPPISGELPPGDHAFMAKSGSFVLLGLSGPGIVDGKPSDNATCARFVVLPFVLKMLADVGAGRNGSPGEGL